MANEPPRLAFLVLVGVLIGMALMHLRPPPPPPARAPPLAVPLQAPCPERPCPARPPPPPAAVPNNKAPSEAAVVMQMDSFYVDFTPTIAGVSLFKNLRTNCGCRKYSLGRLDDGNKFLCDKLIKKNDCIVYSLGSAGEYSFEEAIHNALNCRIVTVDKDPFKLPDYIDFHAKTLGTCPSCTTVDQLMAEIGDTGTMIDFFKTDIEGAEWGLLDQIFSPHFKMVALEFHNIDRKRFESLFHLNDDWCIYNIEYNYRCGPTCIEIAFANRKYADPW